jgi:DNA modification methylase
MSDDLATRPYDAVGTDGARPSRYGPGNPHPFSQIRTELVWEGKYDEYGNRRRVDATQLAMPMQRIETIDEPRARAEGQGSLFDVQRAHLDDFRNILAWGDNRLIAASLLSEFRASVDLIYIDPPFDVGADFTMEVPIGDASEEVEKDQSVLEMVAYRDMWGRGTDSYLAMMFDRLALMRELLSDRGSMYVHCDYRVVHFLRAILDDLFGRENFQNEIQWCYSIGGKGRSRFARKHDTILFYTKSGTYTFNGKDPEVVVARKPGSHMRTKVDADGREYQEKTDRKSGKVYRYYVDEGKTPEDYWTDIEQLNREDAERLGFATQKPEALLKRIIAASSDPGDLVADLFCGSGTTGAVAEKLGRRWIMADLGRFAVHITRKRMMQVQRGLHDAGAPYRAFDVHNLGRYERQWWQMDSLRGADEEHRRVILEFFRAEILQSSPSPLLHGRKGAAYCHVDKIDSIFTREEATEVARAAAEAGSREVICLAWEFEMDLRLECNRLEKELAIGIKLMMIPREIMEKSRKNPPPFLEVATLAAEPIIHSGSDGKTLDIRLTAFIPSLAEVPTQELALLKERATTSGFDFIDFWAVDFDYRDGQPFSHHWQDFRLRAARALKTVSEQRYRYAAPGDYTACVKVVDIFGADTSITVPVHID